MTEQMFEAFKAMVKTAAAVGITFSIWEIILCFVLNKSLHSMWILINTSQFLVFIGVWQIKFSIRTRAMLAEFKRIYLGEFIDDLKIGEKMMKAFEVDEED